MARSDPDEYVVGRLATCHRINAFHALIAKIAITPMLFFLIFAAQEEVYETWFGWLSRIASVSKMSQDGKHDGCSGDDPHASQCSMSSYM